MLGAGTTAGAARADATHEERAAMRILAVDVGTGTQDILLLDSEDTIENACKLVMPAPTVTVARAIRRATAAGAGVLFQGAMMGGGPCHWAARDHVRAGLPFYATPAAARTFDDDLENVQRQGIRLVAEGETDRLGPEVRRVRAGDLDYDLIVRTLHAFGVEGEPDAVGVAVFDHGDAPPGVSDRLFRFDYLRDHVRRASDLLGLLHPRAAIPPRFTRMRAVADSFTGAQPLFLMDTATAAALGALEDPRVAAERQALLVNVGNFHCLAFHLCDGEVVGLFEHHTGEVSVAELEGYLRKLAAGTLTHQEIFDDSGHGALVFRVPPTRPTFLAVTGPRRGMLAGSALAPYLAVPHGDMMLAGCFGLLRAAAPHLGLALPGG
jgi:uncharacterized protein (DUF1786 family)